MKKFKHKTNGSTMTYKDGCMKIENLVIEGTPNLDYWEEIVERDWEILSFTFDGIPTMAHIQRGGKYSCANLLSREAGHHSYDNMIKGDWSIHSVKRLSDGEILTIGDKVGTPGNEYPIAEFKIHSGENTILVSSYYEKNRSGSYNTRLADVIKLKHPLFTTSDGVDVFEGDIFWSVTPTFNKIERQVTNNKWSRDFIKTDTHFAKKENAEKYIKYNEPKYSLNDIKRKLSCFNSTLIEHYLEKD